MDKPGSRNPAHLFLIAGTPRSHSAVLVPEKKNVELKVAFTALWRVLYVFCRFDIRADMGHGEALVLCTGA